SAFRPLRASDRAFGDEARHVARRITEFGENGGTVGANPGRGSSPRGRLARGSEPGWGEGFPGPAAAPARDERRRRGRMVAMPVGERLAGLDGRGEDLVVLAPRKRLRLGAAGKIGS